MVGAPEVDRLLERGRRIHYHMSALVRDEHGRWLCELTGPARIERTAPTAYDALEPAVAAAEAISDREGT